MRLIQSVDPEQLNMSTSSTETEHRLSYMKEASPLLLSPTILAQGIDL